MQTIKRLLKMTLIVIGSLIMLILLSIIFFVNISPQFGGSPSKEQVKYYETLDNYKDGKFKNYIEPKMEIDFINGLREWFRTVPERQPQEPLPVLKMDSLDIERFTVDSTRVTWFGHSAFLLEIDGLKILLDPMFGEVAAPHPNLGKKRYAGLPIEIEKLPKIDAVIFSHDHYDHLDYPTIKRLHSKVKKFYTPLAVGSHLKEWGVAEEKISEFNWWEETRLESLKLVCTPAQHFSGRGVFDRETTLWSSWVITGKDDNIFFSGDGGYGDHFKEIGEKYGPFDLALMECGQYNEQWHDIHMMPEETAQAAVDVNSKLFMPIHWGTFTLSFHSWKDPAERVSKKAFELGINMASPKIGEALVIEHPDYPDEKWWESIK